ncbi:PREDICTED: P2Y purinoceptor 1-like [Nipponia nippon]|uniref:P2Y purinoceptor 1-like n=1 Tax=Nipponia nippon TaxID=128390 RepID=UPI000510DA11|nr:PREDICTED: P2Y purinoceptor 1-like [Nipponia nippon]
MPEMYYTVAAGRQQHDLRYSLDATEEPLQFAVPFTLSKIVLRFLIPVTVIFTCYMLTLKALLQLSKRQQRRNRLVRPLLLISAAMTVFAVSFIPYHVMMMHCSDWTVPSVTVMMLMAELLEHLQRGFLEVLHFNAAGTGVPLTLPVDSHYPRGACRSAMNPKLINREKRAQEKF